MTDSAIEGFFRSLRNKSYSEQLTFNKLSEFCDSSDVFSLEEITGKLDIYIEIEEKIFRENFSMDSIDLEISKMKDLGLIIPYRKLITNNKKLDSSSYDYIDIEALMYPIEFKCLKYMRQLIAHTISKLGQNAVTENPYPEIFTCLNSYLLFEDWTNNQKFIITCYSYIYRAMHEDGLIHKRIGDADYRNWLGEVYDIALDKTKRLQDYKGTLRNLLYIKTRDKYRPYNNLFTK